MPRNALAERRRAAKLASFGAATDVQPITDNVDNMRTAHDVRRLCLCSHCGGLGDREQMIALGGPYHTLCFRQVFGFEAVLALPMAQSGKFRMRDLSTTEMRRLINRRAKTL